MKTSHLGPCIVTALLVVLQPLVALLPRPAAAATPITLSDGAYALIAERVAADRASFFVYLHADSGFNHGFPSAVRDSSWWQPHGMAASVDDGLPATDIHYVRVYRKIPETSEWPQFLVLYIDGNLRLIPHPQEGMARVCFGSSVIVGPAAMSARPANDAEGTCGWSARFRQPSCRVAMVRGPAIE
jgi:hypothetical protein